MLSALLSVALNLLICAMHLEKSLGQGSLKQVLGFVVGNVCFSRPPPMVLLPGTVLGVRVRLRLLIYMSRWPA